MKKERFYRICHGAGRGKRIFRADDGYIYTVVTPAGSIDFAIAKTTYNAWDITHVASGLLACVNPYRTKKDAVQQLSDPDYLAAVQRIASGEQTKTCTQLLNIHKFKLQAE